MFKAHIDNKQLLKTHYKRNKYSHMTAKAETKVCNNYMVEGIRALLCVNYYYDVDIVCAHQVILSQIYDQMH